MTLEDEKYNMKAVSKLVGIQPGTLRAWERRYNIIAPKRNEAGHRVYTDQHIKILKWLTKKIEEGFTVGQAVTILENNTIEQINSQLINPINKDHPLSALQRDLLNMMLDFNEFEANRLLNQAFCLYTVETVLIDIIFKTLRDIWDQQAKREITTAHGNFVSTILRSRIGTIGHAYTNEKDAPKIITVCGPGEEDENGLLILSVFLKKKGYNVINLGAHITSGDLHLVLEEVNPNFLFIICMKNHNIKESLSFTSTIQKDRVDAPLNVAVVSHLFNNHDEQTYYNYSCEKIGYSIDEWENWSQKFNRAFKQ
ncbi:MerR family transcriptional regulator [Bacillus sp. Marseille-P3661]|uniref:MerR family transcriptional regulator n=1 Tax=Bacillus sp. Marseille-P3661 TaxID=1936234 RepID=UPI000C86753B|nr:MerR family transcriptional regulator [Bacillus sp. Marseille-P3661]